MTSPTEVELKFLVPAAARASLAAEMARGSTSQRLSLAARYLDTEDRRLAAQGIAWRLRREGRRWVQTLKARGENALERFEHEVQRADATHDASKHAGTAVGDKLINIVERAGKDGAALDVRYQTDVRRTIRRIRARGAVVEVAFDEGRLTSKGASERIREIEFELVSGSVIAMLALAERWRKRYGLIYDPRSKAERGDRLASGSPFPAVVKASQPDYPGDATAVHALGSTLDDCLAQITGNAIGLIEGDPALRVEHVHQLRIGIRRTLSALRAFREWTPAPPSPLVDGLRTLFKTLGMSRDRDVLGSGVAAELAQAGAPLLPVPTCPVAPDPVDAVQADDVQRIFLGWITWRIQLTEPTEATLADDAVTLRGNAERRLRRWHRHLVADWRAFDELDAAKLHTLRKRVKRQRYAVEFFAPLFKRGKFERYLKPLAKTQETMGQLTDLFVAHARYQELVAADPAAWFAVGWLAARIAEIRVSAKARLGQLVKVPPPKN